MSSETKILKQRKNRLSAFAVVALCMLSVCMHAEDLLYEDQLSVSQDYAAAVLLGQIVDKRIPEASGMVRSRRNKNTFWIINDSGNSPKLHAVSEAGLYRATVTIPGLLNLDMEDMAGFQYKNESYLVFADVGDNNAIRLTCTLSIVKEPVLNDETEMTVKQVRQIIFTYEDGPRDCEAIAVDERGQRIYLITKRDVPARLYEIPLQMDQERTLAKARFVCELACIPRPNDDDLQAGRYGKDRSQITAMDMLTGNICAVNTYKNVYIYKRQAHQQWKDVFMQKPMMLERGQLRQSETLCFDALGNIYYGSEQLPSPLMKFEFKNAQQ